MIRIAEIFAAAMPASKMQNPPKTRFTPTQGGKHLVSECPEERSFVSAREGRDDAGNPCVQLIFVSAPVEAEGGARMKTGFVMSREAATTLRIILEQLEETI